MRRLLNKDLFQLDPEIERTFRQRRRIQRVNFALEPPKMAERPPHGQDEEEDEEVFEEQDIIKLANSKDGGIMDYAIPVQNQLHT